MADSEHSKASTSVAQTENRAGGDVVAGNKNTTNLAIGSVSPSDAITRLLERLIREQKADVRAQKIIDELKRFQVPEEQVPVGLEQKLKDGCREDIIHFATTAKQEFAKKLAQETLFE